MRTILATTILTIAFGASIAAAEPSIEKSIKASYSRVMSVEVDGPFVYVGLYPINGYRQDLLAQNFCFYAREASPDVKFLYVIDEAFRARKERRILGEWNCDNPA